MNPLQTELLARDIEHERRRSPIHRYWGLDPEPLPPRRRPLAWVSAAVATITRRTGSRAAGNGVGVGAGAGAGVAPQSARGAS